MDENRPQFCPWCGSPMPFREHAHESPAERIITEARRAGETPSVPEKLEDLIFGTSFVGACHGCRNVSHVISHSADPDRAS